MKSKAPSVSDIIEQLGGATKAAEALGVSGPNVVLNWRKRDSVPADKVIAVEAATGISRHDLRPDVFGPAPAEGQAA